MKPRSVTIGRSFAAFSIVACTMTLLSWDLPQLPASGASPSLNTLDILTPRVVNDQDTVPARNRKARNIDDVLDELDRVDVDAEINNAMKSVNAAMKDLTPEKLRLEVDKALSGVDWKKIQKDVDESMAKIDWDQIKASIDEVKKIDFREIEKEIRKAQDQISIQIPDIKIELEKAKVSIEKAKVQVRAYKSFINGLEADGLINNKDGYTIEYKDGELMINNKKASEGTMKKYKSFLDEHKKFHIEIKNGEFKMNDSNGSNDDDENDNIS